MKKVMILFILLSLVACNTITKESREPGLQEMLSYLSGNKSFERIEIDHDYHVTLIYQTGNIKFETIQEFLEWYK